MKVLQTLVICSLLVAPQAFAQAARAARGAKEVPRVTRPGAGAKLSEGSVGSTGTVARPNLGVTGTKPVSTEVSAKGDVGGSCGADLSPTMISVIKEAKQVGITGGGCLEKFSGKTKVVAAELIGAMVQKSRQLGVQNASVASVADRALILDAGADALERTFGEPEKAALDRAENLCKNGCDVTDAAFCNRDVFAAARTN